MKRKYQGVTVVGLAVAVIAAFGGYTGSGIWKKMGTAPDLRHQSAINIKVPTETQVRQMDRLYERMPALASPSKRQVAEKKLTLFGFQSPEPDEAAGRQEDGESMDPNGFQLSLIVLAGFGNYCVVDGTLIAEGAQLDDGTQVLKIESHRVLVARKSERKWIYLDNESEPSTTSGEEASSGQQRGQS